MLDNRDASWHTHCMDTQTIQQPTPPQPPKSPEQIIVELRARVQAGQPLTREQVREALAALRQNRLTAAEQAGKKARPSAQPTRSASELLASLKSTTTTGG